MPDAIKQAANACPHKLFGQSTACRSCDLPRRSRAIVGRFMLPGGAAIHGASARRRRLALARRAPLQGILATPGRCAYIGQALPGCRRVASQPHSALAVIQDEQPPMTHIAGMSCPVSFSDITYRLGRRAAKGRFRAAGSVGGLARRADSRSPVSLDRRRTLQRRRFSEGANHDRAKMTREFLVALRAV